MSDLQLLVFIKNMNDPVVFKLSSLEQDAIKRAVDRWRERGVWIKTGDGRYRWCPPNEIDRVVTPAGPWPDDAFNPFVTVSAKTVEAEEKPIPETSPAPNASFSPTTCPNCGTSMIPETVERGPNAGLPKCRQCGRIIRPEPPKGDNP